MQAVMISWQLGLLWFSLLVCLSCTASTRDGSRDIFDFHTHSNSDADHVNCDHPSHKGNGQQEFGIPQESRDNPSRQYLPQPGYPVKPFDPPREEEAPAASFDQPKVLSVENTFVSPTLQKNYNSLFNQVKSPDLLSPSAAQNVPSNALAPVAPRKTNNKKHSDEDDEDNLERLCNDAFHSFLCKPIKGPRKTPTGRLRANAVIPPDVLAGLSSFQDVARVRPDNSGLQNAPNNVDFSYVKPTTKSPPIQPNPSNQYQQRLPLPKPFTTTQKPPTYRAPQPYTTTVKPYNPVQPSPTNTDPQILRPQPSNDVQFKASAQTNGYFYEKPNIPFPPQTSNPSNQNFQVITQRPTYQTSTFRPTTPRPSPTSGYSYDRPRVPFPSNNVPLIAQPPKPVTPHDCYKHNNPFAPVVAKPSNENPAFLRPVNPSTPKPFAKSFTAKPSYSFPSNTLSKSFPPPTTTRPTTTLAPNHDCDKHKNSFPPLAPNPTNQKPVVLKPTPKPFVRTFPESTKLPSPSNNIPQVIAQAQQIKSVTTSPQGYFYEKPKIPFPPPVSNPTNQNPSFTQRPTTPKPTNGYVYDPPRIPFPSNNIAQIVSQPTQQKVSQQHVPCEHDHPSPIVSNPTNQNEVALKPSSTSNGYVYDKPNVPFPPETSGPLNENTVSMRPTTKPSQGYFYDQPRIPFPTNIKPNVALPSNDKPNFIAKPQNQVEVTIRPGYSYNRPSNPFVTPQPSNQNPDVDGYSYPKPSIPFAR